MRLAVVCLVVLGLASTAHADGRPWEAGVSPSAKAEALRLRDEGDKLLVAEQYLDASAKYVAALTFLPHPKLHLAAALTLMKLSRWVEAADHLDRALAYGETGLDDDLARARGALAEAVAHTGTAVVSSNQRKAEISVDGNVALVAPGTARVRVMPGRHVVIAKRGTLVSEAVTIEVVAGQDATASPVLYVTETRWKSSPWKPWVTVGAGVLVVAVGIPMLLHSRDVSDEYEQKWLEECRLGCNPETNPVPDYVVALNDRADRWRYASIGAFVGGGVIAGLGLAWVALNKQVTSRSVAPEIAILPSGTTFGVTGRW